MLVGILMHRSETSRISSNAGSRLRFRSPTIFLRGRLRGSSGFRLKPTSRGLVGRVRTIEGRLPASRPEGATAEKAVPFSKLPPFDRSLPSEYRTPFQFQVAQF